MNLKGVVFRAGVHLILILTGVALSTLLLRTFVTSQYLFDADFFIFWRAAKGLFVEHLSPYDPRVTTKIQEGIYGRPAMAGEDLLQYAYPPYGLLLVWPSAYWSYDWAQAYWMALNLVLLFSALRLAFPRLPHWVTAGVLFYYPVARGIVLGQYALLLGIALLYVYGLLRPKNNPNAFDQSLAGILLAWALLKPHLSLPLILFFFALGIRKRYYSTFFGFAAGIISFLILSFLLVPNWLIQYQTILASYVTYVPLKPLILVYAELIKFPSLVLIAASTGLVILTALYKRWLQAESVEMLFLGCLVFFFQMFSPNPKLSDQIIFLLPILIWITDDPSNQIRVKLAVWVLMLTLPWIIFLYYFHGSEPIELVYAFPIIFLAWFVWIFTSKFLPFFKPEQSELSG